MAIILLILCAVDASAMVNSRIWLFDDTIYIVQVRYISRFTEESFATLIALIFIVESVKKLVYIVDAYTHVAVYNPVIQHLLSAAKNV